MIDVGDLRAAIANSGAGWEAAETPIVRLMASGNGNLFGLALTEPERVNLLARADALEDEAGLLAAAGPPPRAVDWRVDGGVSPVRSQRDCSACVAFALCGVLEGRAMILSPERGTGLDLSEADLFACGCPGGCSSGWEPEAALQRAMDVGIGLEADFPYKPTDQPCVQIRPAIRVRGWSAATTIDARKQAIASNGPVMAGMRTYEDLSYYVSGVYQHVTGALTPSHAVCVVGYDDDTACWIVKNSWGADWGEDGFFRIAYQECGIDTDFPFFDPDLEFVGG